ncbi:nucleoside deaminase [Patescibacteria group bacterium]|nr:nucleoside deaminase [Patescibacteria group bacterium]MBU4141787.1 nucleoside deaminase [Patescibacteria group bacterium]MBU4337934.1 nucleoside deaminase [Patescibacteria group bacterium]MBU4580636.1 nucleoside deaminase [Patescibacteria group bacterium]
MKLSQIQINTLEKLMITSGKKGNLPNGAILIDRKGKIICKGESLVATNKDATAHAERMVIEKVCKKIKSPIIPHYKLVSVFEPCLMCLSAAYWAGIKEIYYIIPACKYWDAIPWVSESKKINKNDLAGKFSEKIKLEHLGEYEKEFSKIFDEYAKNLILRNI